jgi:hypothetical protein
MMCITNDDATRNSSKCNNVMKKENVWRGRRKTEKERNDEEVVIIKENKETKDEK